MVRIKCPHCHKEHGLTIESTIPDKQKIVMSIHSESPFIDSEALGKTIINTTKMLKEIAKSHDERVNVFIGNIIVKENKVKIDFIIVRVKKTKGGE